MRLAIQCRACMKRRSPAWSSAAAARVPPTRSACCARWRACAAKRGADAHAQSVRRHLRHLGRCDQRGGAGLRCRRLRRGGRRSTQVWHDFHAEQVYRADSLGVIRSGRAVADDAVDRLGHRALAPRPAAFAARQRAAGGAAAAHGAAAAAAADAARTPPARPGGHRVQLHLGEHVTFYDAASPIEPWTRSQRIAVPGAHQRTRTCWRRRRSRSSFRPSAIDVDGEPNGSATARCARPRRSRRRCTSARSGCW